MLLLLVTILTGPSAIRVRLRVRVDVGVSGLALRLGVTVTVSLALRVTVLGSEFASGLGLALGWPYPQRNTDATQMAVVRGPVMPHSDATELCHGVGPWMTEVWGRVLSC